MTTTTAVPGLTTPQSHLEAFAAAEKTLPGHDRPAIARLRSAAIASFGKLGFPNDRDEDWKFTSVKPIVRAPFLLEGSPASFQVELPLPLGVLLMSLAEALARHPDLVEPHLGQHAGFEAQPFVALNTAFWSDGVFLHVPDGVAVETPIHLTLLQLLPPLRVT